MISSILIFAATLITAVPAVAVGSSDGDNGHIFCDGQSRDYEGISDLPELEEGECYSTCEMMSKGLACDIEKTEETQRYVGDEKSGFYREDGYPKDTKNRPAINPDFAPDRSCDLKWELKCIPGSEQSCLDIEGYNNGEMNVCTPIGCPNGYHDIFEWENNICYSNKIDCPDDLVLVKDAYGETCSPE